MTEPLRGRRSSAAAMVSRLVPTPLASASDRGQPRVMTIAAPPTGFEGPVKRSITIAGHPTSISLEPLFWTALEEEARRHELPLSALVAQIDAMRIVVPEPPNLASALRSWLLSSAIQLDENKSQ